MTKAAKELTDIANEGQQENSMSFSRAFAGKVKDVVELRNPLSLHSLIYEIDKVLEIINPILTVEIEWLKKLKNSIKLFHNEIVIANRLLGIKNDNEYDVRVFERVVKEKFFMELHGKKINQDTLIQTDFKTMVEMVELGVRRFGL